MGKHANTSMGHGGDRFPSTCWSRLIEPVGEQNGASRLDDGTTLAALYWRPVYAFIRSRWSRSNEDAKDLTQAFFLWMIETDFVRRADPGRGKFRAFLRTALERFLTDDARRQNRRKRGGDRRHVELPGADDDDILATLHDPGVPSPELALDQAWRRTVLEQALSRVRTAFESSGKATTFRVFEDYFLNDSEELDYDRVAARHGISKNDVSNALMQAKRAYRSSIRAVVTETVRDRDELDEELAWLFSERRDPEATP